ncbi:MAG: peptidylprolyl isomerase [Spirochaetales bacterium]|nr:peptidylprolyl isomerase [Spirochaetales bacterium]
MKKKMFLMLFSFVIASASFAQMIDQTVAVVEITRREMLSKRQLDNMYEMYNRQFGMYKMMMGAKSEMTLSRAMIVEEWIKKKVLEQTALKAGVVITDEQCEQYILQMIYQSNPSLPRDRQTLDMVMMQNFNKSYNDVLLEYIPEVKSMLTIQKYVQEVKQKELLQAQELTDKEVQDAFDLLLLKGEVRRPVFLKVHHIFMRTVGLSEAEQKLAYQQMQEVLTLLDNSAENFYKYAKVYSEDGSSKRNNGLLGWLSIADENVLRTFGDEIFIDLYNMKVNSVSKIYQTPQGYHIFLVSDKLLPEVYTLKSIKDPQSNQTFEEALRGMLAQKKYQEIYAKAMNDIYEKEKQTAYIEIFDKDLL